MAMPRGLLGVAALLPSFYLCMIGIGSQILQYIGPRVFVSFQTSFRLNVHRDLELEMNVDIDLEMNGPEMNVVKMNVDF